MKDWYIFAKTYNSYGGHTTLSLLAPFFLKGMPDFGAGLQELSTDFHFAHPGPPKTTMEFLFEEFHADRSQLPKIVYRRARQTATIQFASDILSGLDLHRYGEKYRLDWFTKGAHELVRNLSLLRPRFKKTDNFDFEAFLSHCTARLKDLPTNEKDFAELARELDVWEKVQRESLSDWEKLGIDFRDFHPDARRILDDPFYWDVVDDFAPNGNDTGADILSDLRSWLKRHDAQNTPEFLDDMLNGWGLKDDEQVSSQATIGLAFAEIKLRGKCHPEVRTRALAVLESGIEQAEKMQNEAIGQDWLNSLNRLKNKLEEIDPS